jgi:hypothetical protein
VTQNRRKRRISEIFAIKNHDIEVIIALDIWGLQSLTLMMKQKKSKLESQLLIEPVRLFKLYIKNSIEIIK